MSSTPSSHYVILGVPRDVDAPGIRAAFRALAREHHPDYAGPEATARFQRMVEAYQVLSDPEQRRDYDRTGGARPSRAGPSPAQAVVPLTWWEARQGGRFAVAFPFLKRCDHCRGTGTAPPGICSPCGGSGRVSDAWSLTLSLPPDLRSGDRLARQVAWPDGTLRELTILIRVL